MFRSSTDLGKSSWARSREVRMPYMIGLEEKGKRSKVHPGQ